MNNGKYEKIGFVEKKSMPDYYEKYKLDALIFPSQIELLLGLIKEYTFSDKTSINNVAEIGVSCGLTDLYMLKTGFKYRKDAFHLWGFEVLTDELMGYIVRREATENELACWSFGKGKTVYDIEDFIPKGTMFDMIFIDGAHSHPFPLIDLVYLLPYLREDGLILLHDCEYYYEEGETGNSYIYSLWTGEKFLNKKLDKEMNIVGEETLGAVKRPSMQEIYRILLNIADVKISVPRHIHFNTTMEERKRGEYLGIDAEEVILKIKPYMMKHYDEDFVRDFVNRLIYSLSAYERDQTYLYHFTRRFNYLFDSVNYLNDRVSKIEQLLATEQKKD